MPHSPMFWHGRTVGVVGGTGFLGRHLVHQLHDLGASVRALALPARNLARLEFPEGVHVTLGDVRDYELVRGALASCAIVFNAAGPAAASGPGLIEIHEAAIRQILEASPATARIIHTSSIVTIGATSDGRVLDEDSSFDPERAANDYVRAKWRAEQIALAAADRDVVVVNPGYLTGPEDRAKSFMGDICLRFWHGRTPLAPPGGFNVVDVRDAATGHLLAAELGSAGRRYILGGENTSVRDFLLRLAAVSGYRPRWLPKASGALLSFWATLAEARAWLFRKNAYPSLAEVRLAKQFCYVHSARAKSELGFNARSLDESLRDAYEWHRQTGKIDPAALGGLSAWWVRPSGDRQAA